jgi:hypothetical protein
MPVHSMKNSLAFTIQANYTDWATATGLQILLPTFMDRVVSCVQRGWNPQPVISGF